MALRGGALRGLITRGTRTRCLLAIGAAAAAAYQTAFFAATARAGVAVGTVVTITGCAMLVTSGHASGASAAGVALALLASLCYAVYAVTASYLITNGAGDRAVVGAIFGGAAVLLLPVLLTTALAYLLYARGCAPRR